MTATANGVCLGVRAHSGWAVVVAVGGPRRAPEVFDRRRIEIADPKIAGSKQPFHEAEDMDLKHAEALIARCTRSTQALAVAAVRTTVSDLQAQGRAVLGCGLLQSSGRPLGTLAEILASHASIHAAEGEFFRNALGHAASECGLPVTRVREREVPEHAARALGLAPEALQARLGVIGRGLGPPWRQDEKLATLVGSVALHAPQPS
jgi:hypothetical protein